MARQVIFVGLLVSLFFIVVPNAKAVYPAKGLLSSNNLISGEGLSGISSFSYTASSIPAGTGIRVSFSKDGSRWYDASRNALGWNTLSEGTNTIDLSGLSWVTTTGFYYKMEFTSDGSATPVLDEVSVAFTSTAITQQEYYTSGTLVSTNILNGETVSLISTFSYNAVSVPAGTGLGARFSQNGSSWFNSSGVADGWNTLSQGVNSVDLTGLSWTGANFYYQIEFTSDDSDTPILDYINVSFSKNTLSGTVYDENGTSPLGGQTVRVAVNGTDHGTTAESDGTTGAWSINNINLDTGDVVTVYLEDETTDAVTVTVTDGTDISNLNLIKNYLITRRDSAGSLTNANLVSGAVADETDVSNIYAVASGNLTVQSGKTLYVSAGETFTPGGTVSTSGMKLYGILNPAANSVTVTGALTFSGGSIATTGNNITLLANTIEYTSGSISTTSSGNININSTGTAGGYVLPAITSAGTLQVGNSASPASITVSGAITAGGQNDLYSNGTIQQNASITAGSGSSTVNYFPDNDNSGGEGVAIDIAGTVTFASPIVVNTRGSLIVGGTTPASTLNINGAITTSSGNGIMITAGNINVSADIAPVASFLDLIATGNYTQTAGTVNASNATSDIDIDGNFGFSGGTFQAPAVADDASFLVGGNLQITGVAMFAHNSGRLVLDAADVGNTITTTSSGSDNLYQLKLDNVGTWTVNNQTLDIDSNLTIGSAGAVLLLGGSDTTIDLTGASFSNFGTLKLEGDEILTNFINDIDTGTVEYVGAGTYAELKAGDVYNNLSFTGSGTYTLDAPLDVNGNFSIQNAILDVSISSHTITIGGNYTNTTGTFMQRTGLVTFDKATGTQTLTSGGDSFASLAKTAGGTLQFITDAVTIDGTLTIFADTTVDINGQSLTVPNLANNGILQADGGETITITNFDTDSGTVLYDGGSTYTLQNIPTYNNLMFNNVAGTWQPFDALRVNGNLTIAGGSFDLNAKNLNLAVTSVFSNAGTLRLQGSETLTNFTNDTDSGTVLYDGASTYTGLIVGNNYYHLTFDNATGNWKLSALLDINGNLTLTNGILDLNGYNLTLGGNLVRTSGSLANTTARTLTLNGVDQAINPGDVSWDTVEVSGNATAGSNLSITNLLSIAVSKTLSLASYVWSLVGNLLNFGTINEQSGHLDKAATNFQIADNNFDEAGAISLDVDKLYLTLNEQDANLNGASPDVITGAVSVTCGSDEESLALTETGNATMVFRYTGGLTVNFLDGSPTQENGILECADGATITAQYTDPQNNSDQLSDTTLATVDTKPTAPTGLTGTALSSTSIKWDWTDNSSNETGFRIYSSTGTLITTLSSGVTTYTESDLTKGTTYARKVTAYNNAGNSTYTSTVSVLTPAEPTAPSSLTGTAISSSAITWRWSDNSNDETGFKLYDENDDLIATIATAGTTSYTETGLTKGTQYQRKVAAYNDDGISTKSNLATVATLSLAPASPKLFSPVPGAELSTLTPTFSFGRVSTADGIASYTLLIYTEGSNTKSYTISNIDAGATIDNSDYTAIGSGDSITITLKTAAGLVKGPHTWKIRVTDNLDQTGDSDSFSFTIVITETTVTVVNPTAVLTTPTPAPLEELAQKPPTPTEIKKKYEAGETPSRTSPALWLDNLEKQAELRAEKQALNLNEFLSRFFPIDKLIAFNNGIISFWEGLQRTLLAWFNFAKDQTIAFFMNSNTTIRYRVITIAMTFMQDTESWWERMMREGRANRLALAEQGTDFFTVSFNPMNKVVTRIQGFNVPKDAILAKIVANQTALKQSSNRLVVGTASFFGRQYNTVKKTSVTLLAGANTTIRYKVLAGMATIARNTGTGLKNLVSSGRENRLALAERGTLLTEMVFSPTKKLVLSTLRLGSLGVLKRLEVIDGSAQQKLAISGIHFSEIANNTATLNWSTNRVTYAKVNYGESLMYGEEVFINDYRNKQTTKLTNLKPNTKYYFEIIVTDLQGKQTYDAYYSFTTKGE